MNRIVIVLATSLIFFSCRKEKTSPSNPPPTPPLAILLKDVLALHLPSPYYHFEYEASGKISFVSFASEFTRYDVVYNGDRIVEMRDNILVNKDRLQYTYDNAGKISGINYADSNGIVYTKLFFTYDGQKLVRVDRDKIMNNLFTRDKSVTMTYYADGNLMDLTYHYFPFNGIPETISTNHFERYDDKINEDSFSLLHNEFFDHFFLLPGIQLQKNNPGKETVTGDGANFTVDYTYTYSDKNAPLTKNGDFVYLNGPQAGQHFLTNTTFSYY